MQGTIKEYDQATKTGSLMTDDRTEVAIDGASGTDYRMLRLGQRVRFDLTEVDGQTVARSLRLVTFEA
ncbi:MAG: cold-shock protein [Actinomycetota bacterium]